MLAFGGTFKQSGLSLTSFAFTREWRCAYIGVETEQFPIIIDKVERDMSCDCEKRFDWCEKDDWKDCDKHEKKECEYLGKKVIECKYFRICECKFHEPEKKPCCKCKCCGKFHD